LDPMIGKIIDGYQIVDLIGRGGMGIVYKALDTSLEKIVALKVIDPNLASDEMFLKRFKTEARALARLENPNIVIVHALRETDFGVFMVMEYVEARTVADWIRDKGAFSVEDTLKITKQLLHAISHAHKVEVIHRDIKPSNILLYNDGRVKVTDFGLAKVIQQHGPASTVTQGRAGTLYYMSPEQIKGLKNVDFRSDIYSIGMTVYEMLAGRVPFEKTESDFSIQKQIVEGKIPAIQTFNESIPRKLNKVIQKAIEKDPDNRFQSCTEMYDAIEIFEKSLHREEKDNGIKVQTKVNLIPYFTAALVLLVGLGVLIYVNLFHPGSTSSGGSFQLSIHSTPSGASVYIDDDLLGQTPLEYIELDEGSVFLQLRKEGKEIIDTFLTISRGLPSLLSFTLRDVEVFGPDITGTDVTFGNLYIASEPEGASVFIDNQFVGTTPYRNDDFQTGRYRVSVRRSGFDDYNQTIDVSEGEPAYVYASLRAFGGIIVDSDPSGAEVIMDGRSIGTTPYTNTRISPGSYRITIRKEGYQEYTSNVTVREQETREVKHMLSALQGELTVLVRPWGSIYVNGELKAENSATQFRAAFPVGTYRIRAVHPHLGVWEKEVDVHAGATEDILIDFNRTVNVVITSEPAFCEIYINGRPTGEYTPKQMTLPIGKYTIEVRREGLRMIEEPRTINLHDDMEDPLHFILEQTG
jgi:eukaryotic-like serine/threonine-protein kinase